MENSERVIKMYPTQNQALGVLLPRELYDSLDFQVKVAMAIRKVLEESEPAPKVFCTKCGDELFFKQPYPGGLCVVCKETEKLDRPNTPFK